MTQKEWDEYYRLKEIRVNELIEPICKAFKEDIAAFKYVITENHSEYLILNGTKIGCSGNSDYAIVNEIIKYLFVRRKMYEYFPNGEALRRKMSAYWIKNRS